MSRSLSSSPPAARSAFAQQLLLLICAALVFGCESDPTGVYYESIDQEVRVPGP